MYMLSTSQFNVLQALSNMDRVSELLKLFDAWYNEFILPSSKFRLRRFIDSLNSFLFIVLYIFFTWFTVWFGIREKIDNTKNPWKRKKWLLISTLIVIIYWSVLIISALNFEADFWSVENEWILKCEQSEDYKGLEEKYGEDNVWIKGYRVQEEYLYDWLDEVNEWFFDQPGCLIVMNGMWEGKIIQLELENLEPIFELDLEEFITQAGAVDKELLDEFLWKLETSEEILERVGQAKLEKLKVESRK